MNHWLGLGVALLALSGSFGAFTGVLAVAFPLPEGHVGSGRPFLVWFLASWRWWSAVVLGAIICGGLALAVIASGWAVLYFLTS
jgi:hypothetical protein